MATWGKSEGVYSFLNRLQGRKSFLGDWRGPLMGVGRFRARTTRLGAERAPAD